MIETSCHSRDLFSLGNNNMLKKKLQSDKQSDNQHHKCDNILQQRKKFLTPYPTAKRQHF